MGESISRWTYILEKIECTPQKDCGEINTSEKTHSEERDKKWHHPGLSYQVLGMRTWVPADHPGATSLFLKRQQEMHSEIPMRPRTDMKLLPNVPWAREVQTAMTDRGLPPHPTHYPMGASHSPSRAGELPPFSAKERGWLSSPGHQAKTGRRHLFLFFFSTQAYLILSLGCRAIFWLRAFQVQGPHIVNIIFLIGKKTKTSSMWGNHLVPYKHFYTYLPALILTANQP